MTRHLVAVCSLVLAAGALGGRHDRDASLQLRSEPPRLDAWGWLAPPRSLPPGTPLDVRLRTTIASQGASRGDPWSGTLASPVVLDGRVALHANSIVHGVVRDVRTAGRAEGRTMLELEVTQIEGDGRAHRVSAAAEPVTAGLDAVAVARETVAGALLPATSGPEAAPRHAASPDFAVVLPAGTRLTFVVNEQVALR